MVDIVEWVFKFSFHRSIFEGCVTIKLSPKFIFSAFSWITNPRGKFTDIVIQ